MDITSEETKCLVCDFIRFKMGRSDQNWVTCPPLPRPPKQISLSLRALGEEFEEKYKDSFIDLCSQLHFTEDTAEETFHGVLNEVFSLGITWARVIAVFSFSASLALQCTLRDMPHMVDKVAIWLTLYIEEQLKPWINTHGGWDGVVNFQKAGKSDSKTEPEWLSMKTFFVGITAGALGILSIGAVLATRP